MKWQILALMIPCLIIAGMAWSDFTDNDRDYATQNLRGVEGAQVRIYGRSSEEYGRVDLIYPDGKWEIMAPSHKELAEKMKDRVKLRATDDGSRMWFEAEMSDGRIEVFEGKKVERPPLPPLPPVIANGQIIPEA
jgi:hypothetical protein